ncbi:hypothetical protein SAMN06264364_10680 [Quadrisphaera granulorum]|uniref:FtsX-like permease family protein n=1 Tax=Quadrisphaera granulorum TaxID=317664 RepID=A0A316AWT5_9ACTN|nr:hypothetical protein [Quadrisphaera granulorum]PWJ54637.1 hypothetical protein BXY45_10680 [Quadrisphaera granulorum]SZE95999.1 hypothetical protein SAMN06264364_10680 [Quadrisphaera granulorum]
MLVPWLVLARGRRAGLRHAALVLALALGAAPPVVLQAGARATADGALGRALGDLPLAERSVSVSRAGHLTDAELAEVDAAVRRELTGVVDARMPLREQVTTPVVSDGHGSEYVLAGTDQFATAVRVTSGRAPSSCTPTRCEVLLLSTEADGAAGQGAAAVQDPTPDPETGLVVVGRAVRTDPLLLSGTFDPRTAVLLADGVGPVGHVSSVALLQRTYGWVAPLDRDQIRRSGVAAWSAATSAAAQRLSSDQAVLTAPGAVIAAAAERAQASTGRFGLLAGSCAVLLLGAALCGAAALRPDHLRFTAALRRRGLAATPLRWVTLGEAGLVTIAGTLTGLVLGSAVAAGTTAVAGLPVADTLGASLKAALPTVLGLGLTAWVLITVVLWPAAARPAWTDERSAWRLVSVLAVAGLAAAALVVSRGSAGTGDPLPVLLPSLVLLSTALLAARAWPWAARTAYRLVPRRAVGLRLGVAGVSGHPLLAASTVALLVAGVGASGFAISYRATLLRGAADQAAFEVPLEVRVTPGPSHGTVLSAGSVAQVATEAGAAGATGYPVLRAAGAIRSGGQGSEVVHFVGVEPAALAQVRSWSHTVGSSDATAVARAVTLTVPTPGPVLPAGRTLTVQTDAEQTVMQLGAVLRATDGRERTLRLVPEPGAERLRQQTDLPEEGSWQLIALTYTPNSITEMLREHAAAEGPTARPAATGRITLGEVSVDGTSVPQPWSGWSGDGLTTADDGTSAQIDYRLEGSRGWVAARSTAPGSSAAPLPVAADPVTTRDAGGVGGLVTLTLDQQPVQAKVVAALPRFPTVDDGRFVVVDASALAALLDAQSPGSAEPDELWVAGPSPGSSGAASPSAATSGVTGGVASGLTVQRAADVERQLRTDPVAVGAVRMLLLAAGLTALVGLAALVLLVVGQRDEDAGELYAWETEGIAPRVLRRSLWARAATVTALAVPVGVAAATVLTRLTAQLVPLTAGGEQPRPPLVPEMGLTTALLALVVALALALGGAAVVAASSLREPLPSPPGLRR